VRPLYLKLVEAVPTLRPCLARIDANRDAWNRIIAAAGHPDAGA
jgi:hypothetical protein